LAGDEQRNIKEKETRRGCPNWNKREEVLAPEKGEERANQGTLVQNVYGKGLLVAKKGRRRKKMPSYATIRLPQMNKKTGLTRNGSRGGTGPTPGLDGGGKKPGGVTERGENPGNTKNTSKKAWGELVGKQGTPQSVGRENGRGNTRKKGLRELRNRHISKKFKNARWWTSHQGEKTGRDKLR